MPLSLHKLEGILKPHGENAHDEHYNRSCRARHSHRTVHQALRLEVRVVKVNLTEQPLNSSVLSLLFPCLNLRVLRLKINFNDLVWDWEFSLFSSRTSLSLGLLRNLLLPGTWLRCLILKARVVKGAIVLIWQRCFRNELEKFLEYVEQVLLLLVVKAKMKIPQVCYMQELIIRNSYGKFLLTMWVGQVVLACVADIYDMSDAESLNDMSITSMVPVTKVKTCWENLVWIVLCALPIDK